MYGVDSLMESLKQIGADATLAEEQKTLIVTFPPAVSQVELAMGCLMAMRTMARNGEIGRYGVEGHPTYPITAKICLA